ncbi:hypothetical protein SUGI_0683340 [Cryptomeria japonica]|nr:hypothetical protein SUGI_0683340 [Cryptomeria japonica]
MAAKTLAEQEALKYGAHNKLDLVTILPPTVVGPWLTSTPAFTSSQTILALIGENDMYYKAFKFAQFLTGSIGIVHIDDICNAHIFLMEHPTAQGRHICCTDSRSLNSLKKCVAKQLNLSLKFDEEDSVTQYVSVSSKKLLDMGFTYKYDLEEAFKETIDCAIQKGILKL